MTMPHVEIAGGIVTVESYSDERGTRPMFDAIGEWRFFVESVEADGLRTCMWSGPSYGAAILEAEEMAAEYDEPVVDLVMAGKCGREQGSATLPHLARVKLHFSPLFPGLPFSLSASPQGFSRSELGTGSVAEVSTHQRKVGHTPGILTAYDARFAVNVMLLGVCVSFYQEP